MDQVVEYFRSGRGDDISHGASQFMTNLGARSATIRSRWR
jgi:hypothetical protein